MSTADRIRDAALHKIPNAPQRIGGWVGGDEALGTYRAMALRDRDELRGSNLACWCRIGEACHADALLKLANEVTR